MINHEQLMEKMSPDELVIKLKKLIKKIEGIQRQIVCVDITPSQVRVIFPILKTGQGFTMQELSERGGIDKALVSRVIADLEQKGIVRRDNKKLDVAERNCKILLTPKGEEINNNIRHSLNKIKNSFDGVVTAHDMEHFVNTLNVLIGDNSNFLNKEN